VKITKKQLRRLINEEKILSEMNADGTVSDDEDQERDDLMANVEREIDSLIRYIDDEAERIGGGFRAPGIKYQAMKVLNRKVQRWM
jgi:hypothetical protein